MKKFYLLFALMSLINQNVSAFDWSHSEKRAIKIVGSSTVSPFMSAISEEFARVQNLSGVKTATPIVESTGSAKGFDIFCEGNGFGYPDFVDSSRPIKERERKICEQNDVKEIVEIKIGYDGIVFGNLRQNQKLKLTKEQIFLALAEKVYDRKKDKLVPNFYQTWNQIDAALPKKKILIYGPPLTSGTREVFVDMMLEEVCFHKKEFIENYPDYTLRKEQCRAFRKDGKFIETGENDRLLIENLKRNKDSFGIFGFNFLVENQNTIQSVMIDGVLPSHDTIASRDYPLSRPLFVYFKKDHLRLIPEMSNFVHEIISEETIGRRGYLINSGLVPLSPKDLSVVKESILKELQ